LRYRLAVGENRIALDTGDNDDQVPGPVNFLMSPSVPAASSPSYRFGEGRAPDQCRRRKLLDKVHLRYWWFESTPLQQ
jgi:hypothetical protein